MRNEVKHHHSLLYDVLVALRTDGINLIADIVEYQCIDEAIDVYKRQAMYITPSDNPIPAFRSDHCTKWGLALCTLGIIGLGIASIVYQSIDKLSFGI